ncbi:MAG: DUF1376 domain-containing protein [bacterium]|nr:DUF1376 domain-containing protein [bacterium]
MAKTDIWMPIYLGDYLKDTRHLSTTEHGAYFLILMELWNNKGFAEIDRLPRITLLDEENFQKIWKNIEEFFHKKGDKISQKRLSKELRASSSRRKSAKNNGLKGGRPKTQKKPTGNPKVNPQKTSSPSPSPSHINKKEIPPEFLSLSIYLKDRILESKQIVWNSRLENSWAESVRLMVERDGRNVQDIKAIIDECHDMQPSPSGFTWKNNILSMHTLRKKWNDGKIAIGMNKTKQETRYDELKRELGRSD